MLKVENKSELHACNFSSIYVYYGSQFTNGVTPQKQPGALNEVALQDASRGTQLRSKEAKHFFGPKYLGLFHRCRKRILYSLKKSCNLVCEKSH